MATGGTIICAQYLGSNQKRQGQPSLETIDFFRNSYFYTDNPTMHSIQKTTFKPNLWIRKKT